VGEATAPELLGQVSAQGPPNEAPAKFWGLTATLWNTGAVPPWKGGSGRPVAIFRNIHADPSGWFRVTDISPSIVPPGAYDLRVKGRGTLSSLAQGVSIPTISGSGNPPEVSPVSLGVLRDGDVDGNNAIDVLDLQALKAAFGRLAGEAGFNPEANFNSDTVVDVQDFSRLAQNLGERGK
jgi:hypothetical protein